jgi:transcription termination/antitermination protein NusG
MSLRWYVVQAFSGFEAIVKRSLDECIERFSMQDSFEDILISTEEVVEIRDGKKT